MGRRRDALNIADVISSLRQEVVDAEARNLGHAEILGTLRTQLEEQLCCARDPFRLIGDSRFSRAIQALKDRIASLEEEVALAKYRELHGVTYD